MLRSLLLLFVYFTLLCSGFAAPFAATLGYVWIDLFQPQLLSYVLFMNQFPVALIMALMAFGAYLISDRRSPPPVTPELILQISLAVWVTATAWALAVAPDQTWTKWNWAFKTILFTSFVPFSIRSRVQIEAFLQVYLFALAANFIPFGAKVLISGGGYGVNLGLQSGNGNLAEGGLLSTACLMTVPIALHLAAHTRILPRIKALPFMYWGLAGLAIATAVGTYERSALIGMMVLGLGLIVRSKNKVFYMVVVACVATSIGVYAGASYMNRMATIKTYKSEGSAEARLRIWHWSAGFALEHPLGAGFQAYTKSVVEVPGTSEEPAHVELGRAYHSTFFEVLVEEGFPGFAMYFGLTALILRRLWRLRRMARGHEDFEWVVSLCNAVEIGLGIFFVCGAFVSLGFHPMFWYFVSITLALNGYMHHAMRATAPTLQGWRASGAQAAAESPVLGNWRDRATVTATARRIGQ